MYYRVLQDELQFPEDRTMDQDTKSLIRGVSRACFSNSTSATVLTRSISATPTEPCAQDEGAADQEAPIFLNDVGSLLPFPLHALSAILTRRSILAETGPTCIINATYVRAP